MPEPDRTDDIVSAALLAFADAGYAAVTLGDVARRANVPASVVRATFPSKADIFREAIRSALLGARGELGAAADARDGETTADALRAFARRYWRALERPPLGLLLRLTIAELPDFPELAVFYATEAFEHSLHEIERLVRRGMARGEVGPVDARDTARTVLAALTTYALWFAHPEIYAGLVGPEREAAERHAVDCLLRMLPEPPRA